MKIGDWKCRLGRRIVVPLMMAFGLSFLAPPEKTYGATPVIVAVLPDTAEMTDHLRVRFDALDSASLDPAGFRLRLNGRRFANVLPERTEPNEISFDLSELRKDSDGWIYLAGNPPYGGVKAVQLDISSASVDIHGKQGTPTEVQLKIFDPRMLFGVAVIFAAVLIGLIMAARSSSMLRDTADGLTLDSDPPAPYSLAKCQMAFWFALILASFLGLLVVTGGFNSIMTPQSLTLLGISSVTALGATAIDTDKARTRGSAASTATTTAAVSPVGSTPKCARHLGFWKDILTDDSGFAFHRIQVVVWTLILGGVSLWSAYSKLTLPTFDANLLILMGISSGLYLGLKFPEQQTDKPLP
jgi:hypothetical protein